MNVYLAEREEIMKKIMSRVLSFFLVLLFFIGVITEGSTVAYAKNVNGVQLGHAYMDGKYLYYSADMASYPIMRLDMETGKKKKIIDNKYKGSYTYGFGNIIVKGKYIYAVWDQYSGSDMSLPYIYRISKNGKSKKRLAMGSDFFIAGDRIYYTKCKVKSDEYGNLYLKDLGKMSMRLDGSNKKSEKGNKITCKTLVGTEKNQKIKKDGKIYYITDGDSEEYGRKLIQRDVKTGKKKTIYTAPKDGWISYFELRGKHILLEAYTDGAKYKVIYMKNNGKKRILLKYGIAVS